jgi:hypothetical protein
MSEWYKHRYLEVIGEYYKEYTPTGDCTYMQIKTPKGKIFYAPKCEFVKIDKPSSDIYTNNYCDVPQSIIDTSLEMVATIDGPTLTRYREGLLL